MAANTMSELVSRRYQPYLQVLIPTPYSILCCSLIQAGRQAIIIIFVLDHKIQTAEL